MEILAALNKLAEGSCQRSFEINYLVEKSYLTAVSYLGINHKKIFKLLQKGEYTINDIAVDAIAPLFVPDEQKNLTPLAISFLNWTPAIRTESSALFFLNKVISIRAEQHTYFLLREYDPFFSKILDALNYLIKCNGYKKISLAGKYFVVEHEMNEMNGQIISYDDFENLPAAFFLDKKTIFPNLFKYISEETDFLPAIPLNHLVCRIKHVNFSDYLVEGYSYPTVNKYELIQFTEFGFNAAAEKLEHSYLKKGKLTEFETSCIKNALHDMSKDLLDGGISPGMYEYVTPYLKNLKKEDFLLKYHNILEYLVKVMKNTIAEKLEKEK